jgi:hypothetical protein
VRERKEEREEEASTEEVQDRLDHTQAQIHSPRAHRVAAKLSGEMSRGGGGRRDHQNLEVWIGNEELSVVNNSGDDLCGAVSE